MEGEEGKADEVGEGDKSTTCGVAPNISPSFLADFKRRER